MSLISLQYQCKGNNAWTNGRQSQGVADITNSLLKCNLTLNIKLDTPQINLIPSVHNWSSHISLSSTLINVSYYLSDWSALAGWLTGYRRWYIPCDDDSSSTTVSIATDSSPSLQRSSGNAAERTLSVLLRQPAEAVRQPSEVSTFAVSKCDDLSLTGLPLVFVRLLEDLLLWDGVALITTSLSGLVGVAPFSVEHRRYSQ